MSIEIHLLGSGCDVSVRCCLSDVLAYILLAQSAAEGFRIAAVTGTGLLQIDYTVLKVCSAIILIEIVFKYVTFEEGNREVLLARHRLLSQRRVDLENSVATAASVKSFFVVCCRTCLCHIDIRIDDSKHRH